MQQERKNKFIINYYISSSIFTAIIAFVFFVILGLFYSANSNTIFSNILVWTITIFLAFITYYLFHFIVTKFIKKGSNYGPFINGYAIAAGLLIILIYCLANSYTIDDYSYTSTLGFMAGIITILQVAKDIAKSQIKK